MENCNIFIIGDDVLHKLVRKHVSANSLFRIGLFSSYNKFLKHFSNNHPEIVIADFALLKAECKQLPDLFEMLTTTSLILVGDHKYFSSALHLIKSHTVEWIDKNERTELLLMKTINRLKHYNDQQITAKNLRLEVASQHSLKQMFKGNSRYMKEIAQLIEKAASSNINVNIHGEPGTEKELVAKIIHYNSYRKEKPFVAVHIPAISSQTIEEILFGYETKNLPGMLVRKGVLEQAHEGTLFINEIAELDLKLQNKLSNALQQKQILRVGGIEKVNIDVRLITASSKNLYQEVDKGFLKEELYFRIVGLPIEIAPLRDRDNDMLLLAKHFLDKYCQEHELQPITITADAQKKLLSYNYPGNVSELKTIIELAAVMCNGKQVTEDNITFITKKSNTSILEEEKTLKEYTTQIIQHYLQKYSNNVQQVADKLDIGKSTIYKMMQNKEIMV